MIAGVADVLRAALAPLAGGIRCAFVFGSFARAQQRADSDVDLMVIGDVRFADVARALIEPQRRLGREVNPIVRTPAEALQKLAARHHFLTQVLAGPKVYLLGDDRELARLAEERVGSAAPDERAGNRRPA